MSTETNASQPYDDDQVLTFPQWCALNTLGKRTGRRILDGEYGPPPDVTRLSPNRIGITRGANRRWQRTRTASV
jgi:hypothetical protein